jgi:hypothetical protein
VDVVNIHCRLKEGQTGELVKFILPVPHTARLSASLRRHEACLADWRTEGGESTVGYYMPPEVGRISRDIHFIYFSASAKILEKRAGQPV